MTGPIEAGKAFVKFVLDDKEFQKSLKGIGAKLQNFGKIGLAATGPLVAGFGAATAAFISAGSALKDMSDRTGVGVESLSGLQFAADQSGTSIAALENALRTMAKKGRGGEGSPEERFMRLADEIAGIQDPTLRAARAMAVFGKSGAALLPMLAEGAAGVRNLMQQSSDLGLTMDAETAAAAEHLGDTFDILKKQTFALAVQIGAALGDSLDSFFTSLQPVLASSIAWVKENNELVLGAAAVTAGIAGVSGACVALGIGMTALMAHPMLIWLNAIAAAAIAIGGAFAWASSRQDDWANKWSDLEIANVPLNPKDRVGDAAKAMQEQAQAAMHTSLKAAATVSLDSTGIAAIEKVLGKSMDATAENTGQLVKIQQAIYRLLQGRPGGFVVGAG